MIEYRSVEIRIADDPDRQSPGLLTGVLMPYEKRATDRPEVFCRASLYWDAGGIILNESHNRKSPIVRFVPEDTGAELRVSFPLPDTARARDAATMIRNGTLRGLSVEFVAEKEQHRDGLRVIQRARLTGAGLVDSPSYQSFAEVRSRGRRRRLWL